ncbi:type II toxin-antitoxin system HicA family toxin [Streptomyces cavourensis]|nr:type II toxin-antitoxin system HicA family toxin [Achromobacter sp. DH1f]RBL82768.1 type II toxin-antitoxin system HicA family toxin [Streptomyces cavourensis]
MDSRELTNMLLQSGWKLNRVKGSHHIYYHPDRPGHLVVPHPKKELGKGLVHQILTKAGLK